MIRMILGGPASHGRSWGTNKDETSHGTTTRPTQPHSTALGDGLPPGYLMWAIACVPVLVVLEVADPAGGREAASSAAVAAAQLAMLAAAVGLATHHHRSCRAASGWLGTALAVPPAAISTWAIAAALEPRAVTHAGAVALGLAVGAVSLTCVVISRGTVEAPRVPVTVGLAVGVIVGATAVLVSLSVSTPPSGAITTGLTGAATAGVVALGVVAAWTVVRGGDLEAGTCWSLVAGSVSLALAGAASAWLPDAAGSPTTVTAFHLLAAVFFLAASLRLLALVTQLRETARDFDAHAALRRERQLRDAHTVLHEVRSMVAGLAGATELLNSPYPLPARTSQRLRAMETSELARMQRLLGDGPPETGVCVLGDVLQPVVDSIRARGHRVGTTGALGHRHGDADEVARIVHVLLDNAARHGTDPIEVSVQDHADGLLISVTDAGPGIPENLRDRLFDWGTSGAGSSGIGLHDALTRARSLGGLVRLDDRSDVQTRFVVVLPAGSVRAS